MTKRFGFTLAEVLITLGIIGVVAAMTIPTLISNTNGAQFKTAYKKALSTLNQAVLMNIAMEDTDLSTLAADTGTDSDTFGTNAGSLGLMLKGRMQSATEISDSYTTAPTLTEGSGTGATAPKITYTIQCTGNADDGFELPGTIPGGGTAPQGTQCDQTTGTAEVEKAMDSTPANYAKYSFADGTSFWYFLDAANCTDSAAVQNNCYGFIDVNGATGPNTVISCANADAGSCESSEITDLFPVIFHGQTFEPATASARAVLFGK